MTEQEEIAFMQRCFRLAKAGSGRVAPNPMVGCVIVHDGRIIGEGYHRLYGTAHAEVNALDSVSEKDRRLLPESTLFVNLEPCAHYGKTPPCAERLAHEHVRRVVVCNLDPNPLVAGKGMAILEKAGIETFHGLLADEGWQLNRRFFTYHEKKRPYITLKWAQSADGFIDGNGEKPVVISNDITKAFVHKCRSEEMSILVGTKTALKDNPKLHTRRWFGNNPVRIAIDRNLSIPENYNLYDGSAGTIIYNAVKDDGTKCKIDFGTDILPQICDDLYKRGIQSLLVEGGKYTLEKFIKAGLYDEVQIEVAPLLIVNGTEAPAIRIPATADIKQFGKNKFIRFRNS